MNWIGGLFVILGCTWVGFSISNAHRNQERSLQQLLSALDFMQCELQYRLTPLPDLCRQTATQCPGPLRQLFTALAQELEDQIRPDVHQCMTAALSRTSRLPHMTIRALELLGKTLGRFHLEGQLLALEGTRSYCRKELAALADNREVRLRSYQTLGLCAGAALAILFL